MAKQSSFDLSTGVDLQEVDNAVNNTRKEVQQRYDFKGTKCTVDFDRHGGSIVLEGDDEYRVKVLLDVLQSKLIQRKVPLKNVKVGDPEDAAGGRAKIAISLAQGLPADTAREIVKAIKGGGFKKVQASIQADEVRVSSPSRDELQGVISFLREKEFGYELRFGNYR
ncbi:MAG: YajQ family cyclic di-GMP-binding protein [Gemmatimonadales bacterium]